MTALAADCRYARAAGALWRDTGTHVLVLPDARDADVIALGGGGALVWRLLTRPLACGEIESELGRHAEPPPDREAVLECLRQLVACRVLSVVEQAGPR